MSTLIFLFVPMLISLYWSFTDFNGISKPAFVGFKNYVSLFSDSSFLAALKNTTIYVLLGMTIGPFLGLITGVFLNSKIKGQTFFRTAYFLPVMTSTIVVAMIWRLLYNENGIFNFIITYLGYSPVGWLSNPRLVLYSITAASIWQGFGFETVVFLAALQNIPKEHYEAATIDGAKPFTQFCVITLPALRPVFFFVYCVGLIGSFQVFDLPYALMHSNPNPGNAYTTLVYMLFSKFRRLDLGYASAIAYVLFCILVFISLVQWFVEKKRSERQ
ncbi:carbohydrate ABC transporter permease [Treponema sp. OMZ 840]|uniref:carbohydrate ABC transporter permease n=1 Tax=Treponema sp. OMZ 840 TaxID=244313 RepID=UPI003D93C33D